MPNEETLKKGGHLLMTCAEAKPLLLHHHWHRFKGKVRRLVCILRKQHTAEGGDWGYGMKGIVDRYCPYCMKLVDRVPLDDECRRDEILDWVGVARTNTH